MAETLSAERPASVETRIANILRMACNRELRLATAESCTGGLIASLLTGVDGCSHAFERGFVTYTDAAKQDLLGVDPAVLERHGAVSEAVARAMAEGALDRSRADLALSVTGFAGPTEEGEEGLVHLACARRGGATGHREMHFGAIGRGPIRMACLAPAADLLEEAL